MSDGPLEAWGSLEIVGYHVIVGLRVTVGIFDVVGYHVFVGFNVLGFNDVVGNMEGALLINIDGCEEGAILLSNDGVLLAISVVWRDGALLFAVGIDDVLLVITWLKAVGYQVFVGVNVGILLDVGYHVIVGP